MNRQYIVTGAGGHLGGTILRILSKRNEKVNALLLPSEALPAEGESIRCVYGDVCQPETLRPLFQNAREENTTVIHAAGIISISAELPLRLREVNVEGTRNMLRLSREYGVTRFVYVSSVHAIPELPAPQVIRETDHFSPSLVRGGYAKTKAEASQLVMNAAREGFPAVIVHPSGIIGPYDSGRNHLLQLVADYIRGRLPLCVKGGYDFVDVRDVAQGCLLAAEKGSVGQCYILSGHYLSIRELLSEAGRCCGKKPPLLVPLFLAKLASPLIEWSAKRRGVRPLYTRYALATLTANGSFSFQKAESELGYRPRSASETIRDMTQWLSTQKGGL